MEHVHFSKTRLQGGFWGHYEDLVRRVTVPSVYARFAETGRFASLVCQDGVPVHIFWDSDVAKWIEAVAYLAQTKREPELEALADEAIELIVKNQLPNGYFNSYYITIEPENIFKVRGNHELYCAGHLIEAAVAYDQATGKDALLKAMIRYADHIYQVFYVEKSAAFVTPGHQEIELALQKLAAYTGEQKYADLADYFVDERGKHPEDLEDRIQLVPSPTPKRGTPIPEITGQRDYIRWVSQSELSVRERTAATGHAVRAGYLYTAMANQAKRNGDEELAAVCRRIFRDIRDSKMSITGGVGASSMGEAYGFPYVLPNSSSYNETCATIALAMFAGEMQNLEVNSEYADVIERIWYNGMLSGLSLSGDAFFYENALEIDQREYRRIYEVEDPSKAKGQGERSARRLQRAKVFTTSCCPPNVSRMLASTARHMYSVDGDTIYCHQFAGAVTELTMGGQPAKLELTTNYPNDGKLTYTYHGAPARLAVRIPEWCVEYTGETEQGYAMFDVQDGSVVELELPMEIHFVEANPRIKETAGKCAVTRGPIVYCLESVDNGENLWDITLLENGKQFVLQNDTYHAPVIEMDALRRPETKTLYALKSCDRERFTAKLIPYFAFANRGVSDMQIWTFSTCQVPEK